MTDEIPGAGDRRRPAPLDRFETLRDWLRFHAREAHVRGTPAQIAYEHAADLIDAELGAARRDPALPDRLNARVLEAVRWARRFLGSVEWADHTSGYEAENVIQEIDEALDELASARRPADPLATPTETETEPR